MSDATPVHADDRPADFARPADDARTTSSRDDEAERALARAAAIGLPIAGVVAAVVCGAMASVGSALLVLAASALLGTIGLLWASLRTLTGAAPLPAELESVAARRVKADPLAERKLRVLLALKDLESEYALGKIDSADYEMLVSRYREDAKSILREIDERIAPTRAEAERIANAYLARQNLATADDPRPSAAPPPQAVPEKARSGSGARVGCARCGASNEPDAAFCKHCGAKMNRSTVGDHAKK
ncbi:MAG: zinc ribbon domain-containing protein [Polyangiaceae bacterium]|jgi:hypothetical protein